MSSTDAAALASFYRQTLAPLADRLRAQGVEMLPSSDDEASSWYVTCDPGAPEFFELETASLESELRRMWEGTPLSLGPDLAAPLLQLAEQLRMDEDQAADVSPFMYVMY